MQEYNTKKLSNTPKPAIAGRCSHKKYGEKCSERAYGMIDSSRYCKTHYNDLVRKERKFKSY